MLTLDLTLTTAHHLFILALFGCLLAEWVLLGLPPSSPWVERLARVDLAYGVLAALVLAAGLARVAWGVKGAGFYTGNPVFWTKLGLFALIGLISVAPTLRYLAWRRASRADGSLPGPAQLQGARRWVGAQLVLFAALPVLAALMARGIGH